MDATKLKPTKLHLLIWLGFGSFVAAWVMLPLLKYSKMTTGQIALISISVFLGPVVGPIANPGANAMVAVKWTLGYGAFFALSCLPFIFKASVTEHWKRWAWAFYVFASFLWFFAAWVSLQMYMS